VISPDSRDVKDSTESNHYYARNNEDVVYTEEESKEEVCLASPNKNI
jgi:hypothetical protein